MQRQSEVANDDEDGGYFDGDDDGDDGEGDFQQYSVFYPKTALRVAFYTYFPNAIVHGENSPNSYIAVGFCFMKYEI